MECSRFCLNNETKGRRVCTERSSEDHGLSEGNVLLHLLSMESAPVLTVEGVSTGADVALGGVVIEMASFS